MKKLGKRWKSIGVCIILLVMLTGCGRSGAFERVMIEQAQTFTIDVQQTPKEDSDVALANSPQIESLEAENTEETTKTTPEPKGYVSAASAELDRLLNELEETLNGLEASTEQTDQDALADSTLAELGK